MSSVLEAMKGPIGVAFLTLVTVLVVSEDVFVFSLVCCCSLFGDTPPAVEQCNLSRPNHPPPPTLTSSVQNYAGLAKEALVDSLCRLLFDFAWRHATDPRARSAVRLCDSNHRWFFRLPNPNKTAVS